MVETRECSLMLFLVHCVLEIELKVMKLNRAAFWLFSLYDAFVVSHFVVQLQHRKQSDWVVREKPLELSGFATGLVNVEINNLVDSLNCDSHQLERSKWTHIEGAV